MLWQTCCDIAVGDRCALTRLNGTNTVSPDREKDLSLQICFALFRHNFLHSNLSTFLPARLRSPGHSKRELWTWKPLSEVWPSNSRRFIQVASLIRRKIFYLHTFPANKSVAFCVTVLPRLFMCWRVLAAKKEFQNTNIFFGAFIVRCLPWMALQNSCSLLGVWQGRRAKLLKLWTLFQLLRSPHKNLEFWNSSVEFRL